MNGLSVTCQSICCSLSPWAGFGVMWLSGGAVGHATQPLPAEVGAADSWPASAEHFPSSFAGSLGLT